jgi:hypothetical protein
LGEGEAVICGEADVEVPADPGADVGGGAEVAVDEGGVVLVAVQEDRRMGEFSAVAPAEPGDEDEQQQRERGGGVEGVAGEALQKLLRR